MSVLRALLAVLLLGGVVEGALPPKPATYVSDRAGILSPPTVAALEARLAAYERETSNQILVATFPSIPTDYALEDFTQRTAESWRVGQKDRDNGAVLFIFPNDRKMRIEVGYGLEGALPDAICQRIIQNEIRPAFASGDFSAGVTRGVEAMIQATKGEYHGTGRTNAETDDGDGETMVFIIVCVVVFLFVIFNHFGGGGGTTYGGRRGGGGWFPIGGGSGGGFSGGGGGGFSGGGGSFGGGGASGSW